MKVGLFFGSFNPIHHGHLIIANYMVEYTDLDNLWFVVTPHNPHKEKKSLANDFDRLHLVELATEGDDRINVSDVEFKLDKPSYTIDTLTHLSEKHPNHEFVLIMGGDNLKSFHKWKNYEAILKYYQVYVYKRPAYEGGEVQNHPSVKIVDAPEMQISSSFIRKSVKEGKSIKYLVPKKVEEEVLKMPFYNS